MATRFEQRQARNSVPRIVNDFSESVVYYPRGGKSPRPVSALVERGPLVLSTEMGDVTVQAITIRVANDSTTGISSDELDTGGDEVKVALREGTTPQRRGIGQLLSAKGGYTRFLVE